VSRQSSSSSKRGFLGAGLVALAASLWGLWPLWARDASGGVSTAIIAQLAAGLLTLPWAVAAGRRRPNHVNARDLGLVLAMGLCNAANSYFYFRALNQHATAPAVLSHYLAPVLVALGAPLALREPRSPRTPVSLALALVGTAAILGVGHSVGGVRQAVLLGASSAVFYASATLIAKKISSVWSDAEMFSIQALVAGAVTSPLATLPPVGAAWVKPVAGAVLSAVAPGLLFYAGLRRLPAERVGVLTYLEVLSGVLVGWAAFGERPGLGALLGGGCILVAGLYVMSQPVRD
jgi:drug/metabolite transporter (DMT)-like permease